MIPERHRQILDLFEASVDRSPAARDAYLAERCAGDPDLRTKVESLLANHDPQTIIETVPADRDIQHVSLSHLTPANRRHRNRRVTLDRSRVVIAAAILIAAILLVLLAIWQYNGIRSTIRRALASQLSATLSSNRAAIEYWFGLKKKEAEEWTAHPQIAKLFEDATRERRESEETNQKTGRDEAASALQALLVAEVGRDDVLQIVGLNPDGSLLFSTDGSQAGAPVRLTSKGIRLFGELLLGEGTTVATRPVRVNPLATGDSVAGPDLPSILIGAPVRDGTGVRLGALVFRLESGHEFTRLLDLACDGDSTDVFAFDATGRLLSASRYDEELRDLGLLPREPNVTSAFTVDLRDPGTDPTHGLAENGMRKRMPLTRMAAAAVTGTDGVDVEGYRDVRGVQVVGAWDWLEQYGFGIAIEVEYEQAYAPLGYVRWTALAMLGIMSCLALGTAISSISWLKAHGQLLETRRLGQYVLEEVIGRGGMGTVYRAHHALLRRPTAIKVIDPRQINPELSARFEREVRLASMLTNANTVEIYDYGHTSENTFYCAMELVEGFTLADLVRIEGPVPVGRVIHILRGVCGSLAEAHHLGVIHRDVKPANLMICQRGGVPDVVKVLDFGIAKLVAADDTPQLTQADTLGGTPGYIAPEQLRSPSDIGPTTDIYSLGAVAFFLLTGREAFAGRTPLEVLEKVARDVPPRVADVVPGPIPESLDTMVAACLSKDPSDRPAAIADLQAILDPLAAAVPWDNRVAEEWWQKREPTDLHSSDDSSDTPSISL